MDLMWYRLFFAPKEAIFSNYGILLLENGEQNRIL